MRIELFFCGVILFALERMFETFTFLFGSI